MGVTKFESYTDQQIEYAKFFKALGHPARIAAIENLVNSSGEAEFEEVFKNVNLAQSTKSEHLKKLTEIGLVATKLVKKTNRSCLVCCINKEAFDLILKYISTVQTQVDSVGFEFQNFYIAYKLKDNLQSTA